MTLELTYLWAFTAITCGSLADTLMWGDQAKDLKALRNGWGHIPWLIVFWGICIPTLPVLGMRMDDQGYIDFLLIMVGFSAWWDLLYTRISYGVWIHPIHRWLVLGRTEIGFGTRGGMLAFILIRLLVLPVPIALRLFGPS